MGVRSRREIEEMWRARLRLAEKRYQLAAENLRTVQQRQSVEANEARDTNFELQKALQIENQARAEYLRLLQTFTRLILYGQIPEEEPRSA